MTESYEEQTTNYAPPRGQPTNGLAIASFIVSVLGLIGLLPVLGSVAGLIMGYMARTEIEQSAGTVTGLGLAQWGIILGWVGVGIIVALLCLMLAGVAVPGFFLCAWSLGNM